MSYLHCPTCRCAYNLASATACPRCGIRPGAPVDPVDDVVAAAEQLARAVGRATPAELARAQAELALRDAPRALPAPDALPATPPSLLRAVRAALAPRPIEPAITGRAQQALLATLAIALLARLPRPRVARRAAEAWAHVLPRVTAARALLRN